ncbi:Succinyl-CoA synthetase alpha chain [Acidilobus saccharovorans 345-15]|uniref:Succinate--CoA ligase [ADP-forming] subunit alpha n=1 Tax=Acidilobus saccharovorans (strain DSM 16705 / JCM 18335 / VKM B-2471 / 345-15) TaxID=666510 RepID=D9Q2D9_ACIS3|nr:succinate--CoA ligase subunit alpha [Acidilobus saccharovorans]ADL19477.1 Succinyl-CoA synthetase alpha chain [Acidilobus saccharovorans 345-15]
MGIIVDENTKVIVQGITGREGSFHTRLMLQYGTKVVAGVTPGKGGTTVEGVPVYDTMDEAVKAHPDANTSIIFVPAKFAADAVFEAIDAGIKTIVVITEHIPIHDAMAFVNYAKEKGSIIIGPNCPGIINPGKTKVGIMPANVFTPGPVGVMSRSGTLTYEVSYFLSKAGLGQSTVIGVGGDPITGLTFPEVAEMFERDPQTKAIVMVGEIGGDAEERVAKMVKEGKIRKPIVAFIAGRTAPEGKRMGHAGAIIMLGTGAYKDKVAALEDAGVRVAITPYEIPKLVSEALKRA